MFSLLYVDDEPDLLEIGRLFLEDTGEFEVSTVESGQEALAHLGRVNFDAIVSDYQMPGMTGIELLKSVRKTSNDIPFILFTGRGREEVVIEAINNGTDFYLQKGGDPKSQFAELAHKLRQAIGRKRAEKALSDSEKRLADIINFLPDATFAIDTDGLVIAWNRAIEEMTGISAPDILGKGDYEYAIPFYGSRRPILIDLIFEPDETVTQYYSNIRRDGNTLSAETNLPHPKGSQIYVLAKASPLFTRNGDITGAIESIRDITERKISEEELHGLNEQLRASDEELRAQYDELAFSEKRIRESEEKYRTIIDHAPAGMHFYELKPDGSLIFTGANPAADEVLKTRHADYIGKAILDVFPGLAGTEIPDQYREVASTGKTWQTDNVVYENGKIQGAFSVSAFQISPGLMVAMFIDITERKKAETELHAAYEQVAAAEEELRSQYDELVQSESRIRVSEARLRYMLGFYERAGGNRKTLMDYAVEGAGKVTQSPLGYLAFLNKDESELTMYAWSKSAMKECTTREKPLTYKTEKTGLWGEPVRERRPVITNDYAAPDPKKKGYPEGHPLILRHMGVPVVDEGHVVLVAGVANKSTDYTEEDAQELLLLVQGLWQVLKRKETETALIENEARFRSIFENSPYPIVINNRQTHNYVAVNAAFLRESGYTESEVLGKDSLELGLILPEDQARIIRLLQTENRVEHEPVTRIAKDGKKYHILISSLPVMLHNEPAILTMTADISELERTQGELRLRYEELAAAQKELKARQQQMEEIAATVPGVVYQYYQRSDGNTGFYFVNVKSGKEIFGLNETVTDFLGWFIAHVHEDDRAGFINSVTTATAARKPWNFEGRFVKPSGEEIWFSGSACPVEHETELVFTGILADITERKQNEGRLRTAYEQLSAAEEELREQYDSLAESGEARKVSEEKYRLLVEVTGTGYVILDEEGRVLDANPEYVRLAGRTDRSEVLGRSVLEWTAEYEREKNAEAVRRCLREGSIQGFEIDYADRDGHITPVEIDAAVVHEKGKVRIITLCRDISELKRSERAIRETSKKLNLLNSITRHDVANQLTSLLGYTQLAIMSKPEPAIVDFLTRIENAAQVIRRQIEFTRTYQELGEQAPAWQRIGDLVRDAALKNITITCTCGSFEIYADPMLEKVFFNLFDNAVRHGEHVTAITIRCETAADELTIFVEDNGVGIPLDEKPKLFRKGYGKNTGFGLFLAREILAITGISINETGTHGKGARFEIAVPKNAYRPAS
nr:PAS domain S-box protein [uncultured Methanoregula sp.]